MASEAEAGHPSDGDPGGCAHYRNGCEILAPCCDAYYRCHRCHNEEREHLCGLLDRSAVVRIRCVECEHVQPPAEECENCRVRFAEYVCLECNLFRQAAPAMGLYHCADCGICRVGKGLGEGGSHWHCHLCCACLPNSLDRAAHRKVCRPDGHKDNCAICFENMHDSAEECVLAPYCGHYLHQSCYIGYLKSGKVKCPLCQKPLIEEKVMKRAERMGHAVLILSELAKIVGSYVMFRFLAVRERNVGSMDIEMLHIMHFFFRVGGIYWWEGPRRDVLRAMTIFIRLTIYALILTNLLVRLKKLIASYFLLRKFEEKLNEFHHKLSEKFFV